MTEESITFRHMGSNAIEDVIDSVVAKLYIATHADVIDNPFYSVDRFTERVRGYIKSPTFEMVAGSFNDDPIGLAFGYVLPREARWWRGLTTPVDPKFIAEDGARTFGLCELMIHPDWQGRGLAHALHDELLGNRPEQRASLLVREDNRTAQQAYLKWGWRLIGKLQPYPDSPHYDVLVLEPLP